MRVRANIMPTVGHTVLRLGRLLPPSRYCRTAVISIASTRRTGLLIAHATDEEALKQKGDAIE